MALLEDPATQVYDFPTGAGLSHILLLGGRAARAEELGSNTVPHSPDGCYVALDRAITDLNITIGRRARTRSHTIGRDASVDANLLRPMERCPLQAKKSILGSRNCNLLVLVNQVCIRSCPT